MNKKNNAEVVTCIGLAYKREQCLMIIRANGQATFRNEKGNQFVESADHYERIRQRRQATLMLIRVGWESERERERRGRGGGRNQSNNMASRLY